MTLILDRAEFYALTVLLRATTIVGLDPAALVAADHESQQSLFVLGRDQLRDRDLIRSNERGSLDLEQGVADLLAAIVRPERVVMAVRRLPAGERDLLMFYGRDDAFVELSIPRIGIFRLARVGSAEGLIARLIELLPITDQPFVPETLTLAGSRAAKAFQLVMEGRATEARALLEETSSEDPTLARYLVDVIANATLAGNITLLQPMIGDGVRSSDITVIHSPDETWSLVSSNGSDRVWAERTNGVVLRGTLRRALSHVSAVEA